MMMLIENLRGKRITFDFVITVQRANNKNESD